MQTSFSTAFSALMAHSTAIDVVGNNLANLNTPGFKASTVSFHDLVSQSLGDGLGETQVGFGVAAPITLRRFNQGAIQSTGAALDAAIQGDGFFVVKTPQQQSIEYTRGGNFIVDKNGTLTTTTGEFVQGWSQIGGVVDTNLPIGNITVPVGTLKAPTATTLVSADLNLDATATDAPPADTFSTSLEVFDSLGISHVISMTFTKSATANTWDYSLTFPDADLTAPGTPTAGTLVFSPDGQLSTPLSTDVAPILIATGLNDGAADMSISWSFYDGSTPRLTQFAQPSATSAFSADGSAAASLVKVAIGNGGTSLAQYSDGEQVVVGQMAMAAIRNPESLIAVGNNNYQLSARSAIPAIGLPGTGGRGTVLGGTIEASTSDITKEFTNLIVFQRSYQANARMITTSDEVSQETINMKR